jgi:hypothetical protein
MSSPPAPEHDEQDETNAEGSTELHSDWVTSHRSEEERVTEAQKKERVKEQLQVGSGRRGLISLGWIDPIQAQQDNNQIRFYWSLAYLADVIVGVAKCL